MDVRALEASTACLPTKPATADPQSFTRVRGAKTEHPWWRDSVTLSGDRIILDHRTDARLMVDGTAGRGSVFLAPELGRCPSSDIGRHIPGRTASSNNGSYEFRKDTVGRGANAPERFILTVKNGAAIMQWRSGQLLVRALDEQISNVGGTFTVVVDSVARRGVVTVQDGLVTMRVGTVAAGQSFTFGAGQPGQPVVVREAGLDEINFHSSGIWKNPVTVASTIQSIPHPPLGFIGRLPWKKITVGTVGIGAASYAAWKFWPKPAPPPLPPVKAIVVITIPL